MTKPDLNPEQRAVVEHGKGPLRVGATAGSGKTTALIERVAHLIGVKKVPANRILMISFSRVARDEMKRRIDKRLPGMNAGGCARTFHSIGLNIFKREVDPDQHYELDTSGIMYLRATEQAYRSLQIKPEKKAIIRFAGLVKNNLVGTDEALRRLGRIDPRMMTIAQECTVDAEVGAADMLHAFFKAERIRSVEGIEHRGDRRRFVTFDDMIYQSAMLLKKAAVRERWAARWDYVLQDECQDVNEAQAAIAEALCSRTRNYMVVGDPSQCHPPGVMIDTGLADGRPVEELWASQVEGLVEVRGWNRKAQKMIGGRRANLGSRHYDGELVSMHVDVGEVAPHTRTVPMTVNHRILCRWHDRSQAIYVTYMMYREDLGFRVGWCQLFAHRGPNDHQFHLGHRSRLEKADRTWILGVHRSRTEASVNESVLAMRFGLPTVTFEPVHNAQHLTRESLDYIFAAYRESDQNFGRAHACLFEHGRRFEYPFYPFNSTSGSYSRATYFEVFACNLEPGLMAVPLGDMRGKAAWVQISRVDRCSYRGPVYSLDVEKDHAYAANGVVVLNSIYGWRGSRPEKMLDFEKEWPGAKTITMHRNYRSGMEIVGLANDIMGCMPAGTVITDTIGDATMMVSERKTHSHIGCHVFPTSVVEANRVADNIREHKREGIPYGEQAVLLRMNRMTRDIEIALATRGIPYRLLSGQSFFLMKEAQVLFGYLRVMLNRADEAAFKACIMNPTRKLGNAFIKKVAEGHDMVKKDWLASVDRVLTSPTLGGFQRTQAEKWLRWMRNERIALKPTQDPQTILERLRDRLKLDDHFNRNEEDQEDSRSSESLDAVCEFAHHFGSCAELLDTVERVEKHRDAHSRKKDAVTVSTVHKMKGSERQVVYIIQVAGGLFPASQADLNEERRCFYVACTRAKDELWISRPAVDGYGEPATVSRFLVEVGLAEQGAESYRLGRATDNLKVGTQMGLL